MPALALFAALAKATTAAVFEHLIEVALAESGVSERGRQQLRQRLGKKSPEQLAFRLALERALRGLDETHPGWTQSLFDETLLTDKATARELAKLLQRKGEPDAGVLAAAWTQQMGTKRPELQEESAQVAVDFVQLLDEALNAADVRPVLALLRDSRDLATIIDQNQALQTLVEKVLQRLDAQKTLFSSQIEILAMAKQAGLLQIQRRDVTIYGDASQVIIVTGDSNRVTLQLSPEQGRELSRYTGSRFAPAHLDYLRHWFSANWAEVQLADMLKEQDGEVGLLDVYVPLRVDFGVKIQVKDQRIIDWWVDVDEAKMAVEEVALRQLEGLRKEAEFAKTLREKTKIRRWDALGVDEKGMQAIVDGVQRKIDRRRKQGEETKDGEHSWFMEAQDAASVSQRFVLLGAPGSGKSSFLRHLTLCMAGELRRRAGENDVSEKANLDEALNYDWLLDAYTPIYVEIRELVRHVFPALPEDEYIEPAMPDAEDFWLYIRNQVLGETMAAFLSQLRQLFAEGKAILLLDGLDEAPQAADPRRRKQIKRLVASLVRTYPRLRIIITSRPHAYRHHEWSLPGFGRTELRPLGFGRLRQLARALFTAVGEESPEEEANVFIEGIRQAKIEESMRRTPLFFTMLAGLWLNEPAGARRLPKTRAELYRQSVDLLLDRWTRRREPDPAVAEALGIPAPRDLRAVLEILACTVQDQSKSNDDTTIFKGELLAVLLYRAGVRVIPQDLTDYLSQHAGILVSPAPGEFHFVHKSFQEHLAACELTAASTSEHKPPISEDRIFPHGLVARMLKQPDLWENVLELAVDELLAHDRSDDLWRLVAALLVPYAKQEKASQAAIVMVTFVEKYNLMPATLETDELAWIEGKEDELIKKGAGMVVEAATKALSDIDHFPSPEERDIAGRLLGQGNFPGHDPRRGVGVKDGLPDLDWVCIPACEFIYQDDERREENEFWITRYPVTYAQFETFLQAEDGFHNPEWWRGLAASETQRRKPDHQWFEYWNHPRENVSWHDAIAFSRWLTARARKHPDLLPEDLRVGDHAWRITLPTEWQWERAARGTEGREYPWGSEYISGYANVNEKNSDAGPHYLKKTSAVGMYPQGTTPEPEDIFDLSGNVWEWCLNEYENPERFEEKGNARRVLRGVSWDNNIHYASARPRFRIILNPGLRGYDFGFRLVVVVSVPK